LVTDALRQFAKPSREERKSSIHISNCESRIDFEPIVTKIRDDRAESRGEIYNTTRIDDKTLKVEVTYVDVDPSRALVYQREEKKLTVEISQEGDKVSFIHSANEKALEIVNELRKKLSFKGELAPQVVKITLKGVRDPKMRTKFFTELIKDVDGYKFLNATQLNVDRRLPLLTDPANENEEAEEVEESDDEQTGSEDTKTIKTADQIKSLVNKVSLSGDQVLADKLYQMAEKSGYFISNICWSCTDAKDPREGIDCVAGFKDPIEADEFTFDVARKWKYKADAPDEEETVGMNEAEQRALNRKLEAASLKAFSKITNAQKKSENSPAAKTTPSS
jgi:hypothetical protein